MLAEPVADRVAAALEEVAASAELEGSVARAGRWGRRLQFLRQSCRRNQAEALTLRLTRELSEHRDREAPESRVAEGRACLSQSRKRLGDNPAFDRA